jgi:hypothetical protein
MTLCLIKKSLNFTLPSTEQKEACLDTAETMANSLSFYT